MREEGEKLLAILVSLDLVPLGQSVGVTYNVNSWLDRGAVKGETERKEGGRKTVVEYFILCSSL